MEFLRQLWHFLLRIFFTERAMNPELSAAVAAFEQALSDRSQKQVLASTAEAQAAEARGRADEATSDLATSAANVSGKAAELIAIIQALGA